MYINYLFLQVGIDISRLDGIIDDLDFTEKLIAEQSVFCLPGKVRFAFEQNKMAPVSDVYEIKHHLKENLPIDVQSLKIMVVLLSF